MFTGIIEDKGKVENIRKASADAFVLTVNLPEDWKTNEGQSIAINGACLTVTSQNNNKANFDVMPETIYKTSFSKLKKGDEVNLERAMAANGRFEGHIVQGHVDDTGQIRSKVKKGNSWEIKIQTRREFAKNLVDKGSVAVDGISLTISKLFDSAFEVSIIPLTADKTTLGFKKTGDYVNLEADILGKYILMNLKRGD